jgi:mannose/fructose-specific phosphotransferase system component IIA
MVRVLVLTHGRFGHELVAVAEKILGPVSGIDVMSNEERSALHDQGGSCATAALCAEADRPTAIVIGGLNLAMLLGLILWRESLEPQELADRLVEKGRQAIIRIEPPV